MIESQTHFCISKIRIFFSAYGKLQAKANLIKIFFRNATLQKPHPLERPPFRVVVGKCVFKKVEFAALLKIISIINIL